MPLWMRKPLALCLVAASSISTSLCKADVQAPIAEPTPLQIDVAAIQQDPRLEKPVTLSAPRLPLKAVLDQWGAQTGIALTIDAHDPSSGYPLLAECMQVPVGKMMNALYGLLSIHGGEWEWERSGKADAYQYALHETWKAKNRTKTYTRILKEMMRGYVAVLRDLAPMKMEERKRYRATLKKALYLDDDKMVAFFFESEGFWNQANFFFGALSLDQQDAVLEHNGVVTVSLKTLPHDVYDLFHLTFLASNSGTRTPEGTVVPDPEPESVQFFRSSPNRPHEQLAPMIEIVEVSSALSWMGTGHLEPGIRNAIKHAWMLPGDSATDPIVQTLVKEPTETEWSRRQKEKIQAEEEKVRKFLGARVQNRPVGFLGTPLGFTLIQLAQGSDTPLLAMLPTEGQSRYSTPVGKLVQLFLDDLEGNQKEYIYKWRNGVLLVSDPFWFAEPVSVLPFSVLRSLHPDKVGHIPLIALSNLMRDISDDQAQWFAAETGLQNFKQLRPCLLLVANNPGVLQPAGISLDDATARYLQSVAFPRSVPASDAPMQLRVREEMTKDFPSVSSFLNLEAYDTEQKKWALLNQLPLPVFPDLAAQAWKKKMGE